MSWIFDLPRLKTLRELKGLSQRDFATAIDKTEESYRLKELGRSPITADELCAIGTAYDIDPRAFFTANTVTGGKRDAK